jgi:hypothetical protein
VSAPDRLDALMRELAATRPVLDDLTRARVAARLAEQIAARPAPRRRRWPAVAVVATVATAAAALALVVGRPAPAPLPVAALVAPLPTAPVATASLASGQREEIAAEQTVTFTIDSAPAAVTVLGPGWIRRDGERMEVEAAGLVVDRPPGEPPLEIVYRGATVRIRGATFGAQSTPPRVHVIRGEVAIDCGGSRSTAVAGSVTVCPDRPPAVSAPVAISQRRLPPPRRADETLARPSLFDPFDKGEPEVTDAGMPDLYAEAEAKMAAGDLDGARALLEDVVAADAPAADTASALLDLARLAMVRGAPRQVPFWLDRIPADARAVAEPALHLRCAALLELRDPAAATCAERFLRAFPSSPRRAELATRLVEIWVARGECDRAAALSRAEVARRGSGPDTATLRAWAASCRPTTPR